MNHLETSACPSESLDSVDQAKKTERFVHALTVHTPHVRGFIRSLVRSADDVDEVMQAASIVAWRKYDEFDESTCFAAWLTTIARFEAMNHRRRQHRDRLQFSDSVVQLIAEEGQHDWEHRKLERSALTKCIDNLPNARRELIVGVYLSNISVKRIAEKTGRSIDAVYMTLSRVRRSLLSCMQRRLSVVVSERT